MNEAASPPRDRIKCRVWSQRLPGISGTRTQRRRAGTNSAGASKPLYICWCCNHWARLASLAGSVGSVGTLNLGAHAPCPTANHTLLSPPPPLFFAPSVRYNEGRALRKTRGRRSSVTIAHRLNRGAEGGCEARASVGACLRALCARSNR